MRRGLFALQQCEIQEEDENSYDAKRFAVEDSASRRSFLDVGPRNQRVPSSFWLGAEQPEQLDSRSKDVEAVIARIKGERQRQRMGVQVTSEEVEAKKAATIKELEKMCVKEQLMQNMKSIEERMEARRKKREELAVDNRILSQELLFNGSLTTEGENKAQKVRQELESMEGDFTVGRSHAGQLL